MPYVPEHDETPNPLRAGLRSDSAADPCAVVIFGASGDLAHRKLVPALYNLAISGHLPAAFGIVGVSKSEMSHEQFARDMREAVGKFSRTKPVDPEVWQDFAAGMRYVPGSFGTRTRSRGCARSWTSWTGPARRAGTASTTSPPRRAHSRSCSGS